MQGWKHTQASYNADIVESDLLAIFDSGGELIIMLLKRKPIPHSWRSRSAVASCACLHLESTTQNSSIPHSNAENG